MKYINMIYIIKIYMGGDAAGLQRMLSRAGS